MNRVVVLQEATCRYITLVGISTKFRLPDPHLFPDLRSPTFADGMSAPKTWGMRFASGDILPFYFSFAIDCQHAMSLLTLTVTHMIMMTKNTTFVNV